ncbi:MAG: PTS sugar transporter subunit IIA, partial [Planctomycetes bacterium]|nr:PTS sugar transporter subunit IIA [Planctomycetota bacterium]
MELSKYLSVDRIRVPLSAADKTAAITELVDVLAATDGLIDRDVVLDAVLKREAERSTGIGYGLAIPHGKSAGCNKLVMAAGQPAEPIDFQSID